VADPAPSDWRIEIVCTNRGQHKRTWITAFSWTVTEGWLATLGDGTFKHPMFSIMREDGQATTGFACSRCRRRPKIPFTRLEPILDEKRRQHSPELDVSKLS
jgi:hypothetical protein